MKAIATNKTENEAFNLTTTNSNSEDLQIKNVTRTHSSTTPRCDSGSHTKIMDQSTDTGKQLFTYLMLSMISIILMVIITTLLYRFKHRQKCRTQVNTTNCNLTDIEQLENDRLASEFPNTNSMLDSIKKVLRIDKYRQQRQSISDGLWYTDNSSSASVEECEEEVFNREIVYDEEAAMNAFKELVNKTPVVYGWHSKDSNEQTTADFDEAAYTEFKNIFVASSLKHRPSILTEYDDTGTGGDTDNDE